MRYLLDTNVCVRYLAGRSLALRARLKATPPAAIALANRLVLVTHNTAEFSRVPGLLVEDWETEPSGSAIP